MSGGQRKPSTQTSKEEQKRPVLRTLLKRTYDRTDRSKMKPTALCATASKSERVLSSLLLPSSVPGWLRQRLDMAVTKLAGAAVKYDDSGDTAHAAIGRKNL